MRLTKAGLIVRKECWSLTWRAWAILLLSSAIMGVLVFHQIFPFLAVHAPIQSDFLVVEGWLPDYALQELKEEFKQGQYKLLIVVGNPVSKGEHLSEYKNYSELTRANLLRAGWDEEKIVAVSSGEALRDRTFAAALALRTWSKESGINLDSFNILTRGAHSRRTRLLYKKAFQGTAEIGIISGIDLRYDPKRWWASSEGVREVLDESIAFFYAKFFFRFSTGPRAEPGSAKNDGALGDPFFPLPKKRVSKIDLPASP